MFVIALTAAALISQPATHKLCGERDCGNSKSACEIQPRKMVGIKF